MSLDKRIKKFLKEKDEIEESHKHINNLKSSEEAAQYLYNKIIDDPTYIDDINIRLLEISNIKGNDFADEAENLLTQKLRQRYMK